MTIQPMIYRISILLIALLAISTTLTGQRTTSGLPLGITGEADLLPLRTASLTMPDIERLRAEDERTGVNRFAAPISTNISTSTHGNWTLLPDGKQVWQLRLAVPEAQGLLLFYEDFALPHGSALYVYSPNGQVLGAYTSASVGTSDRFMTGILAGGVAILEYQAPPTAFMEPFRLFRVDAVYRDAGQSRSMNFGFGSSDDCHDNSHCTVADEWQAERDAVARIIVVVEEGSGYCTGTLLNNTAADGRLLFLSAFHCMDGFTPQYDLWRFDFQYAASGCADPVDEPIFNSILGSTYLAGRQAADFLLLDVNAADAADMDLHWAGWDRTGNTPDSTAKLHHPRGDIQKFAKMNTQATVFTNPINWSNGVTTPANHHYRVRYTDGTTEVGSSGAALFDKNHRVVGQLHGDAGNVNCNNALTYYGRLSMAWDGESPEDRLRDWLDPLNLAPDQWDALGVLRTATVRNDQGVPVADVSVEFWQDGVLLATTTTTSDGRITIPEQAPITGTFSMRFSKPGTFTNGVTTADLIRMQRQVLNTELLPPFRLLACDVNNSNSFTTLDMIRIRKLILTLNSDFGEDGVPSWQFFVDEPFSNPTSPWSTEPRSNEFTFTIAPGFRLPDFIVAKSGDANGNATY